MTSRSTRQAMTAGASGAVHIIEIPRFPRTVMELRSMERKELCGFAKLVVEANPWAPVLGAASHVCRWIREFLNFVNCVHQQTANLHNELDGLGRRNRSQWNRVEPLKHLLKRGQLARPHLWRFGEVLFASRGSDILRPSFSHPDKHRCQPKNSPTLRTRFLLASHFRLLVLPCRDGDGDHDADHRADSLHPCRGGLALPPFRPDSPKQCDGAGSGHKRHARH